MLAGYPDQAPAQPLPEPLAHVPLSMQSVIDVFMDLVGQVGASRFFGRWSEAWAVESISMCILGVALTIFGTWMVSRRFAKSRVQALVEKKSSLLSLYSSSTPDIVVIKGRTRNELLVDRDEPLLDEDIQAPVVTEGPHLKEPRPVPNTSLNTDWSPQVPFILSSTPVGLSLDLGLQEFSFGGLIDESHRFLDILADINGAYHDIGVLTESIGTSSPAVREEGQVEFLGEGPSLVSIGSSEFGSALVESLDYGVPIPLTTTVMDWTEEPPELLAITAHHPFGDEPAGMDWAGLTWMDTSSLHRPPGLSDALGGRQDQDTTHMCNLSNIAVATQDFGPSLPDDEGGAISSTELSAILKVVGLQHPSENPVLTVDQDAITLTKTMAIGDCCEVQVFPSSSLTQGQPEDEETAVHIPFVGELVDVAVVFSQTEDANVPFSGIIEGPKDVVTYPCIPSHATITTAELTCSLADTTEGPTVTGPGTSPSCFELLQPLCASEILDSAEGATASAQTMTSTTDQFDGQNLLFPTSLLYESEGLLIQSYDDIAVPNALELDDDYVPPPSLFVDEWKQLAKLEDHTNCQCSIDDNITLPFSMFWKRIEKSGCEGSLMNKVCNLAQDDNVAVFDVDRLPEQVTPAPSDSCNSTHATPEAGPGPSGQGQGNDQDVEEAFPSFDFLQQIPEDMEKLITSVLEEPAELIPFPSELEDEPFMPYSSTEKANISGLASSPLGNPKDSVNAAPDAMTHNVKKSSTRYGISQWEERLLVRKSVADLWQPRRDIRDALGTDLSLDDASMFVHGKEDLSEGDLSQDCFFAGHLVEDFNEKHDISAQKLTSVKNLPPSELKNNKTKTSYAFLWQALPTNAPVTSSSENDELYDASTEVLGRDSSYEEDISQAFLSDSSVRDPGNRSITTQSTTSDLDSVTDQSILLDSHMGAYLGEDESMDITDLLLYTGPVEISDAIGDMTFSLMPGEDKSGDWGFLDAMQGEWEAENQL
ncbi:hypothetical protein BDZ94DRAFT_1263907 [Collybia nuda]|uniref:Transmembrane protein n=1 Tax=Collybia nuda TaxID=64659 RepID=A0A9P5Y164_9AGAR|nr:hypothetical protein BDZ94DRAFT_1263907 [Collybia nuda]